MHPNSGPGTSQRTAAPLWVAAGALLSEPREEFFRHLQKTARSLETEEVHDLRVASRRLREGLTLFGPCYDAKRGKRALKRVKKVTTMLGELRNTDEAFLFFSQLAQEAESDVLEGLLAGLRSDRVQAHRRLKKELSSLDMKPLRKEFEALLRERNLFVKGEPHPFVSVNFFAYLALRERAKPLGELLPQALQEQDREAQHALRIALKKMRYRMEILAPLMRRGYAGLHAALKRYQDVLGQLHDLDVFGDLVQERVAQGAGRDRLLQVISQKRSGLFARFRELQDSFPISCIGERATDAL